MENRDIGKAGNRDIEKIGFAAEQITLKICVNSLDCGYSVMG